MSDDSYNYLFDYYTTTRPDPRVPRLCGTTEGNTPYTTERDEDLTAIINAYAKPEYLPLIWEGIQYQTRRPKETWIIQNNPAGRTELPLNFLQEMRRRDDTVIVDSGLNHGCWFRFLIAAFSCRTRYVAVYDDDTLSGRRALETAMDDLARTPGLYGGRGCTFKDEPDGPHYWQTDITGWPVGTEGAQRVDYVSHLWITETYWLKELFKHVPDRLFAVERPWRECGEDMYLSFVAQKLGLSTFTYHHGMPYNECWSSIQAYEMGLGPAAMNMDGGLAAADIYLQHFLKEGWELLRYPR